MTAGSPCPPQKKSSSFLNSPPASHPTLPTGHRDRPAHQASMIGSWCSLWRDSHHSFLHAPEPRAVFSLARIVIHFRFICSHPRHQVPAIVLSLVLHAELARDRDSADVCWVSHQITIGMSTYWAPAGYQLPPWVLHVLYDGYGHRWQRLGSDKLRWTRGNHIGLHHLTGGYIVFSL